MQDMKHVHVTAFFPEVSSIAAYQSGRGDGSKVSLAVERAVREIFRRKGISGKRIRNFKLTVAVMEEEKKNKEKSNGEVPTGQDSQGQDGRLSQHAMPRASA